jgi:Uma2 family endonuclease
MPLEKTTIKISEKEYLEGELISEIKHEYIDGYIYAMAGASENHDLISGNIFRELGNHLKQKKSPCNIFSSDIKVRISQASISFFILTLW